MAKRSPIYFLAGISKAKVKLFHEKCDPTVSSSLSIRFFNRMIAEYPKARTYLDVFDGEHEIDVEQAMCRLLFQYKKRVLTEITS